MESPPSKSASTGQRKHTRKPSTYPPPFVVRPLATHKSTLILLHGRGANGPEFGQQLLQDRLSGPSSTTTFQTALPNTKFIFPTAAPRRAKWYNRALISQWFDSVPIDEQEAHGMTREEEEWQVGGLRETGEVLKGIVDEEVESVGVGNVVLGGLSQGCAMAVWFLLGYEGREGLGGFVGMSGWCPFAGDMEGFMRGGKSGEEEGDDVFDTGESSSNVSLASQVRDYVREQMDLPPIVGLHEPSLFAMPVLLGHGVHDEKVKIEKGRRAADILRKCAVFDVTWKEYNIGHWYRVPEQLDDIVGFLKGIVDS